MGEINRECFPRDDSKCMSQEDVVINAAITIITYTRLEASDSMIFSGDARRYRTERVGGQRKCLLR